MKVGEFVQVDYIGRVKETGEIFDLTIEDVAKKEKVYNPKLPYRPVVLIIGSEFIIKGVDEALRGMKVGERKRIDIPPSKAFGERKEDFVRTIPSARFKEQNIDPAPGGIINIGNMRGRIVSTDGGRVKVDFNHPLAGKTLEYDIEVKSLIEDKPEKVKAVVQYFTGIESEAVDVDCGQEETKIEIKKDVDIARPVKKIISETIIKWCSIGKVKFIEVFGTGSGSKKALDEDEGENR